MKMPVMDQLTRDSRWAVFSHASDFNTFKSNIVPELYFKPQVPESVIKSYRVIQKLIEHSYFEYEFYDVAASKALMTFEMALKIRYRELNDKKWKGDLQKLIEWFRTESYLEVLNDEFLDRIRKVRNIFAHPEEHSFGGPFLKHWIYSSADLINDLYEDRDKRRSRMESMKQLHELIVNKNDKHLVLLYGNHTMPVYDAGVLFIDDKQPLTVMSLYVCPLFELENGRKFTYGKKENYQIRIFSTCHINILENEINWFDFDSRQFYKLKTAEGSLASTIREWKQGIQTSTERFASVNFIHVDVSGVFSTLRRRYHMR